MNQEDFGPVHACPKCGVMVQYVKRHTLQVLEDCLTGGRHSHHEKGEPLPRYMECTCGENVILKHGQKYDLRGQIHKHDAPAPQVEKPKPAAPPVKRGSLSEGITL